MCRLDFVENSRKILHSSHVAVFIARAFKHGVFAD